MINIQDIIQNIDSETTEEDIRQWISDDINEISPFVFDSQIGISREEQEDAFWDCNEVMIDRIFNQIQIEVK